LKRKAPEAVERLKEWAQHIQIKRFQKHLFVRLADYPGLVQVHLRGDLYTNYVKYDSEGLLLLSPDADALLSACAPSTGIDISGLSYVKKLIDSIWSPHQGLAAVFDQARSMSIANDQWKFDLGEKKRRYDKDREEIERSLTKLKEYRVSIRDYFTESKDLVRDYAVWLRDTGRTLIDMAGRCGTQVFAVDTSVSPQHAAARLEASYRAALSKTSELIEKLQVDWEDPLYIAGDLNVAICQVTR